MSSETKMVSVRVPKDLVARIDKLAAESCRKRSGQIIYLLTAAVNLGEAMAVAGRAEPSAEDVEDIVRIFVRWCQDWEPK